MTFDDFLLQHTTITLKLYFDYFKAMNIRVKSK